MSIESCENSFEVNDKENNYLKDMKRSRLTVFKRSKMFDCKVIEDETKDESEEKPKDIDESNKTKVKVSLVKGKFVKEVIKNAQYSTLEVALPFTNALNLINKNELNINKNDPMKIKDLNEWFKDMDNMEFLNQYKLCKETFTKNLRLKNYSEKVFNNEFNSCKKDLLEYFNQYKCRTKSLLEFISSIFKLSQLNFTIGRSKPFDKIDNVYLCELNHDNFDFKISLFYTRLITVNVKEIYDKNKMEIDKYYDRDLLFFVSPSIDGNDRFLLFYNVDDIINFNFIRFNKDEIKRIIKSLNLDNERGYFGKLVFKYSVLYQIPFIKDLSPYRLVSSTDITIKDLKQALMI